MYYELIDPAQKKEKTMRKETNPDLSAYFSQVERYSAEHLRDIERFKRLLESMQGQLDNSSNKIAFAEVRGLVNDFDRYLSRTGAVLSPDEKNEISAITGSGFPPPVKKRILENFLRRVRDRVEAEILAGREHEKVDEEIRELETPAARIIDWLRVTGFALHYGTLTPFTHRLRGHFLGTLKYQASQRLMNIVRNIKPVLDREYYALSTLEYNLLAVFLKIEAPLRKIEEIPNAVSFKPPQILQEMNDFTEVYSMIVKNGPAILSTLKKIFKKKKPGHGFWGDLYYFLDQPVYNNKPVIMTDLEVMRNTIRGLLFSYHTAREKKVIRTLNQIIYLLSISVGIPTDVKQLTPEARIADAKKRDEATSDEGILLDRYHELERISGLFLPMGESLEKMIYAQQEKKTFTQWMNENRNKPILRFKKTIEAYLKYFIEYINTPASFILVYDGADCYNYFEISHVLQKAVAQYTPEELDLMGTKFREAIDLTMDLPGTLESFIETITNPNIPKWSFTPAVNLAREFLHNISVKTYQAAIKLNDLITGYYREKEIIHPIREQNFDFYTNAVVKKQEGSPLHALFRNHEITLQEFLERSCALAFHICRLLNHEGVQEFIKEKNRLLQEHPYLKSAVAPAEGGMVQESEASDRRMTDTYDDVYLDRLTGLYKMEYIEDILIPSYYGPKGEYQRTHNRFIVYCSVDNLRRFNSEYGHDAGDIVIGELGRRMNRLLGSATTHRDNIAVRLSGDVVVGFLNDTTLTAVAETMASMNRDMGKTKIRTEKFTIPAVSVSIGIYQERPRTMIRENIASARKLMSFAHSFGPNTVAFTRDPNHVITKRDHDRFGNLDRRIVTTLT